MLTVDVSDDGRGFEEDHRPGVGLSSMRERAEELGGTCVVEPVTSGGTRVKARLPLEASAEGGEPGAAAPHQLSRDTRIEPSEPRAEAPAHEIKDPKPDA